MRGALVGGGDLEGAAGAGGGLLEDQRDVPAPQPLDLGARLLGRLQLGGQVDQAAELLGGEVQLLEEVAACRGRIAMVAAPGSRRSASDRGSLYEPLHCYTEPRGLPVPASSPAAAQTGVPLDRAAHAARPAPAPAQLAARDLDHLDALLAQMGVGGDVALVGDHHARLDGEHVAAVVPLLALRRVHVLGRR